jgi:hypothetical protein
LDGYNQLLIKYVGADFEAVCARGAANDIITAYVVFIAYQNVDYNEEVLAEWLGCEEYKEPEEEEKN